MKKTKEQKQLTRYTKLMKLVNRMLLKDDLGIVSRVVLSGGIAASQLENKLVYDILKK